MLRMGSRVLFVTVFITALMAFLTFWLQVYSHFEGGEVAPNSEKAFFIVLRANLAAAGYFLVLSGYLFVFLTSYFLFTKAATTSIRIAVSSLLFVAAFIFFMLIIGDSFSALEGALLIVGIASVAMSDVIAGAVVRSTRS